MVPVRDGPKRGDPEYSFFILFGVPGYGSMMSILGSSWAVLGLDADDDAEGAALDLGFTVISKTSVLPKQN